MQFKIINGEAVIRNGIRAIWPQALKNCTELRAVVIPDSVKEIGREAFMGCENLTSVVIGNSVKEIGRDAFKGCESLASVVIGNSVKEIGREAFMGCENLASVVIGNSVKEIGSDAFKGCKNLVEVVFGNSVTQIGWDSFQDCKSLTDIVFPDSLKEICAYAFYGCDNISSFELPDGIEHLGALAITIFPDHPDVHMEDLKGRTLKKVIGLEKESTIATFFFSDGSIFQMFHTRQCCERVEIEDVCGDVEDLLDTEILLAEESTSVGECPEGVVRPIYPDDDRDSFTWTFYKLATRKGYVDIRWYGESNGFYSESVNLFRLR